MDKQADLAKKFATLGVPDPESWASSQLREGIDQISRATMLRAMADIVIESERMVRLFAEADWVTYPVRNAANRLCSSNEALEDMGTVVKAAVYHALSDAMVLSDGNAGIVNNPESVEIGLFRLDENFEPKSQIDGLHESWSSVASAVVGKHIVKV
jgi:hypothetical protein